MATTNVKYAVFKIPTSHARKFANAKNEQVSNSYEKFDSELQSLLENFQQCGNYDELTSHYAVRPVKTKSK